MKIFISSVITGFEDIRAAATDAIRSLGHQPLQAEDFPAAPTSPRVACLAGVREAEAVVLLLGARYGWEQNSGFSATHEEYREARERCPVFAFVQSGVELEPEQKVFVDEVQGWSGGRYTGPFTDAETLRAAVTTALHRWEVTRATGTPDPEEMAARAVALLPARRSGRGLASLAVAFAGGPPQPVLRPSELEDPALKNGLLREALFGDAAIFTTAEGSRARIDGHALHLEQDTRSLLVDEQGSVFVSLPLTRPAGTLPVIIEEDVREALTRALRFGAGVLARVDPVERLSQIAVMVTLVDADGYSWRTRLEHAASPNAGALSFPVDDGRLPVRFSPPHRSRAALQLTPENMADDFVTLLRRAFSS